MPCRDNNRLDMRNENRQFCRLSACRWHVVALLGICLLTVCAFLPTFWNGFQMEWDDQWMVFNPMTKGHLDWDLLKIIFTTSFNGQWGPLNQLAYTVIFRPFGYDSLAYHVYSLMLHVCNVCLVWLVLSTILSDCAGLRDSSARRVSLFATVLFAVHPLQVETVAWISASKILLSSAFYLGAAYAFVSFLKHRGVWSYVLTVILFGCSYLSKENVLTFPFLTVILSLMYGIPVRSRAFWRMNLPFFVLALLFGLHLVFFVSGYSAVVHIETFSIGQRVILCCYTLMQYVIKWAVPVGLSWMHFFPTLPGSALPFWMVLCPVALLMMMMVFWNWIRKPIVFLSLLFFVSHLLFVLHLLFLPRNAIIAERYMYLPIIGLNVILAYAVSKCVERRRWRYVGKVLLVAIVVSCVALTYSRTGRWYDSKVLRENDNTPSRPTGEPEIQSVNHILYY